MSVQFLATSAFIHIGYTLFLFLACSVILNEAFTYAKGGV
jgi:hypothetical protein